jgi:hypothetical protein
MAEITGVNLQEDEEVFRFRVIRIFSGGWCGGWLGTAGAGWGNL